MVLFLLWCLEGFYGEFESEEGKAILKKLGISGSYEGIGHCILGYALDTPDAAPRKPNRVVWVE